MTKNPNKEWVRRGMVKKAIDGIKGYQLVRGELKQSLTFRDYLYCDDIEEAIDKLPAMSIKGREEIERKVKEKLADLEIAAYELSEAKKTESGLRIGIKEMARTIQHWVNHKEWWR